MNPIVIFSVCLVLSTFSTCRGKPASSDPVVIGKYQVSKRMFDDGKYKPVQRNEGRYIHMVQPYVHVHDNRELGQYVHIHNPYGGGYGPYSGLNNPYRHDDSGNYEKYTTSSTTTRRPTTTTTTTIKPRLFNYHEEGGWRILRQEEEKAKHKYDFLYHTENGIYGEEKANLRHGAGTAASGYYEYTGDDGELYRVNYKSDEHGFIPEADHIPTPPPVPDAIKRALEYVAKKKETHGIQTGQYEHKADPIRRQNMPTADRPFNSPLPALPTLSPKPYALPAFSANPVAKQFPAVPQLSAAPQFLAQQPLKQTALIPTLPLPTLGSRPSSPASIGLLPTFAPKTYVPPSNSLLPTFAPRPIAPSGFLPTLSANANAVGSSGVLPTLAPRPNAPSGFLPTLSENSNAVGSSGLLPTLAPIPNAPSGLLPTLDTKPNAPGSIGLLPTLPLPTLPASEVKPVRLADQVIQQSQYEESQPEQLLQVVEAPKDVSKVQEEEIKSIRLEQPVLAQQPQLLLNTQPVQVPQLTNQFQSDVQPQQDQSQPDEQPQQDQPQPEEQLQQDQPQEEQPLKKEEPLIKIEEPQQDQPAQEDQKVQQTEDIATYVLPDESSGKNIDPEPAPLTQGEKSQASEQEEKFEVPYKVEEILKDKDSFELTTP